MNNFLKDRLVDASGMVSGTHGSVFDRGWQKVEVVGAGVNGARCPSLISLFCGALGVRWIGLQGTGCDVLSMTCFC